MKNKLYFLITFFLLVGCYSQNDQNLVMVQFTDRNGVVETISSPERLKVFSHLDFLSPQHYQKVLRVFKKNQHNISFSVLTNYHPNGNLFQYLEIQNARAKGVYREWHPNGQKRIEAFVIGGPADLTKEAQKEWLFDGISRVWDDQGFLSSEIPYAQGELIGNAKYYYPSGSLQKIIPYKNNQIHGDVLEYSKDETLISKTHYQGGKREGPAFSFFGKDQILSMEDYSQDCLIEAQYFDLSNKTVGSIHQGEGIKAVFVDGKIYQLIQYHHGLPEGSIKQFFPNGDLQSIYHVKKGQKQGEELLYYDREQRECENALIPKVSITWDQGEVHGTMKTWFPSGKLESQRQMCHNKKNGPYCAWYKEGSIMLIEEYENDLLIKGRYYKLKEASPVSQINHGTGTATIFDELGVFQHRITYQNGIPQEP